ncbi:MAG: hypothetical protein KGY39_04290 [Anaerolineales bacterium]|nr:hypothetical protein [Anaerolineales bacterium]MBS3753939.1 hypothetical protein [Anaerolineales bacterium]
MKSSDSNSLPPQRRFPIWILGPWVLALGFLVSFSTYYLTHLEPTSDSISSPVPTAQKNTLVPSKTATNTTEPRPTIPTSTPITPTPKPSPTKPTPTQVIAKRIIIGKSVEGRYLEVFQFGSGNTEKLIIAGIHGGYEWNTIALADALIQYLKDHPELVPSDQTLYILRSLNPDGEARSHGIKGRANEHGVDLNRNFPDHWRSDWSREGCWNYLPITAGTGPASEPEAKALISFIEAHNVDALINYHSAALGIFAGGKPATTRSLDLAEEIASISTYPYPPIDTGCQFSGQLIDWAAEKGIAAVDIELTNHQDIDFKQNLLILNKFLSWGPPD